MKSERGRKSLSVAFGVVFGVGLLIGVAGLLDTGGDHATRGLSRFAGIVVLGFLAAGLAVFVLARATALRVVAVLLAGAPLLAALVLVLATGISERAADFEESARYRFPDAKTRSLGDAIERNDLAKLRGLLSQGVGPDVMGRKGETPLSFAMRRSNVEAAVLLIRSGADPNRKTEEDDCPLVRAAGRDAYVLVLEAALAQGASPDSRSVEGRPLLLEALAFNAKANVRLLVEKGARLDVRDPEGRSVLVRAIFLRMWPQARLMVERGAPIHEPPGIFNLEKVLTETRPPDDATPEREEFRALLESLAERGIVVPERKGT